LRANLAIHVSIHYHNLRPLASRSTGGVFQNRGAFLRSWPTQVGRFRPAASGRPPPSRSPQGDRWRKAPAEPEFTRPVHH
jgi:hypothetical protein